VLPGLLLLLLLALLVGEVKGPVPLLLPSTLPLPLPLPLPLLQLLVVPGKQWQVQLLVGAHLQAWERLPLVLVLVLVLCTLMPSGHQQLRALLPFLLRKRQQLLQLVLLVRHGRLLLRGGWRLVHLSPQLLLPLLGHAALWLWLGHCPAALVHVCPAAAAAAAAAPGLLLISSSSAGRNAPHGFSGRRPFPCRGNHQGQ
jgi:hypothetical protein